MLKILELFGGIGAPRKALLNLGVKIKSIDYVEILDWAVLAYGAMYDHKPDKQSVVGWNLNVDILIHGSPCQDFSTAGKGDVENGGRSNLYTETLKIIDNVLKPRPKIVVWENVKGLISKKHFKYFQHYLDTMDSLGYNNYYKVLIATDFGIPQKRERVFTISIRKDIDNGKFNFDNLEKQQMKPLKQFLEDCVDIKYFLKQESMIKAVERGKIKIINNNEYEVNKDYNYCLADGSPRKCGVVREKEDNIIIPFTTNHQANIVNKTDTERSKVNTLTTNQHTIKIAVPVDETNVGINILDQDKCNTITTKQWRWNNAGVVKIPLTTFNAENYIRSIDSEAPTITAAGANSRIKIAIPKDELEKSLKENNLAAQMQINEAKNYIVYPRSKDGKTISGAYNRAWKTDKDDDVSGTITASNKIQILKPKKEIIELIEQKHNELKELNKIIKQENENIRKYNEWAKTQEGMELKDEKPLLIPKANLNEFNALPVFIIDGKPYVVRILTERECWRLMGFTDNDFDKVLDAGVTKNGLYHLAGNSIVVQVLEAIFKEIFKVLDYKKGE